MSQADKIQMARLAHLERKAAELHATLAEITAERAKIFQGFAEGETYDVVRGRRRPREAAPEITPVSELTAARATHALRQNETRRRIGR
jgi:hypothetical protein